MELTKKDKILFSVALFLFCGRVIYFGLTISYDLTEDMIHLVGSITYMYIVALFALIVSLVAKLELTKRDQILVSIIFCLFFVHVVLGMLVQLGVKESSLFTLYTLPVSFLALFVWSWFIMTHNLIGIVFEQYLLGVPSYTFFCNIAWISLFVLIIYTKGMKLVPRIAYLYLIPALVMSLAYLYYPPFS
ncbi:MAG: hypothetical protein AB3K77_17210 [Methanosarcinaceae archaeon]